jgi:hypothetical protein
VLSSSSSRAAVTSRRDALFCNNAGIKPWSKIKRGRTRKGKGGAINPFLLTTLETWPCSLRLAARHPHRTCCWMSSPGLRIEGSVVELQY